MTVLTRVRAASQQARDFLDGGDESGWTVMKYVWPEGMVSTWLIRAAVITAREK
ncbi:hypothetical protein HFO55_31845 [Rhizobium leguminosarum]|uniref:hypothetical protein n=1 Tax=Rhizobium leguminosarum TaxID=384 RepID=UPI001C942ABA|nr:hypothetical protein [Rhizobium leguminosarum]MBY5571739.1 hypothetical protein [Rhizobium leguminosarum]MBY5578204.1 hypothetical protein [Rhizobium leguminosarum]